MFRKKHILILALAFMGLSAYVANAQSGTCGANLNWSYNSSTGALTITGSGAMSDYNGSTSVAPWYDYGIASVSLPNGLTSIGDYAFCDCSGLTSVTIPNSVTSIGRNAFYWCKGLTSITIPNSVTSIGGGAFYKCSGLTGALTIPNSVTKIDDEAFAVCSGLTSVTTPNSVTSISVQAFSGCKGLTSVTIPNSVTSIGGDAFYGCSGLTSVTISNSVTSIGNYTFQYCSGLTSITIPNPVISIGNSAFSGCSGLTSVINERLIPQGIDGNTFRGVYNNATLYVPTASLALYREAEGWQEFKNILPLEGAFANYEISLSATPAKGGTVTGSGTAQENTNRTVTAAANAGYIFAGWQENGKMVSNNASYTFSVTGNRTLVAVFYETNIDVSDIQLPANKNVAIVGEDASARVACRINLNATGYSLVIYGANGADVICSLEFNAAGNLLSISFGQQTKGAEQDMFGVKINNLSANTTYYYKMQTLGEGGTVLATEEGSFKTTGAGVVGMLHATSLPEIIGYYTLTGQRLAQAPEKGIYIILYDNGKAEKVLRKK